jgi:DNA modification methylase
MLRKPGAYRSPTEQQRALSRISKEDHAKWFRQAWFDIPGASTKKHPAPFPEELAYRLIRMFSFQGDTVLDPFGGTGTTAVAALRAHRNAILVECDREYAKLAKGRLRSITPALFAEAEIPA